MLLSTCQYEKYHKFDENVMLKFIREKMLDLNYTSLQRAEIALAIRLNFHFEIA